MAGEDFHDGLGLRQDMLSLFEHAVLYDHRVVSVGGCERNARRTIRGRRLGAGRDSRYRSRMKDRSLQLCPIVTKVNPSSRYERVVGGVKAR